MQIVRRWLEIPLVRILVPLAILMPALAFLILRAGITPDRMARMAGNVDTEVILLFVPLCALMLALTGQVLRIIARGGMPESPTPSSRPIRHWQS